MGITEEARNKINKLRFGWSKFGGARREFVKEEQNDWTCQACATRYSISVPCYMTEIFDEEFAKICAKCQNKKTTEHIIEFDILIQKVRFVRT